MAFPDFSIPKVIFHDFPDLENFCWKSRDFPDFSRICMNPMHRKNSITFKDFGDFSGFSRTLLVCRPREIVNQLSMKIKVPII